MGKRTKFPMMGEEDPETELPIIAESIEGLLELLIETSGNKDSENYSKGVNSACHTINELFERFKKLTVEAKTKKGR